MSDPCTKAVPAASGRADRFTAEYFLLVMSALLLLWYSLVYNLSALLPSLLFAHLTAAAMLAEIAVCCLRRRWRGLSSVLAAPVLAFALVVPLDRMGLDLHWAHLQLQKPAYLGEIARCDCGSPGRRFKTFDWSTGAAVPDVFYTLVYDESDEIARPAATRTVAWSRQAGPLADLEPMSDLASGHAVDLRMLEGHFYLVTETY